MIEAYPSSGEINRTITNATGALAVLDQNYVGSAESIDHIDGLSISFTSWRFNLRSSNTEPVVRLNVESRGDARLMAEKIEEVLHWLELWQKNN